MATSTLFDERFEQSTATFYCPLLISFTCTVEILKDFALASCILGKIVSMKKIKNILIIDTGGTFNKIYHPINGSLEIDSSSKALKEIATKWMCSIDIQSIIHKDSLEMTKDDRAFLLKTIGDADVTHIIVLHGTDTIDRSAAYIAEAKLEKSIVFTGAMVPYSIDPVEATANLASAYGYLQALEESGVYIAMHGILESYKNVKKNRKLGRFEYS